MSFFSYLYRKILSPYHYLWAFFSALFFGFPARKIKVIGVTGTKGKSTVVELTEKIFREASYKVASFSSIKIKIADDEKKNLFKMTMPGRWHIQKFLKEALKAGCKYAILEVTSEGILQHRHRFINFEAVVFTNLSPEHIERHGSFEKYRQAKMKLFRENANIHIMNLDDENTEYFLNFSAKKEYGFTTNEDFLKVENIKIIRARDCQEKIDKVKFKIDDVEFKLNIVGGFNIYNALAAICTGLSQGISLNVAKDALRKIKKIPGRMELVIEEPFKAIVDYAHTPDSLEAVYQSAKKFQKEGSKIICVLGAAGGGRDKWKRKKLGEIAEKYCDEIIITNEDPYDENPLDIMNEVASGVKNKKAKKVLERRDAIAQSLRLAKEKDIVMITGKGCEPWMCIANGKKIPWDDRKMVKEEFNKIN